MTDGEIRYLQIPALDVETSVGFYGSVFGWTTRTNSHGELAFDDASEHVSGAWVPGRAATAQPGLLVWVRVDNVEATLERIENAGGEVISPMTPQEEGEALATFRDPAGNVLGIFQEPRQADT